MTPTMYWVGWLLVLVYVSALAAMNDYRQRQIIDQLERIAKTRVSTSRP